jgi:hypothetical protein
MMPQKPPVPNYHKTSKVLAASRKVTSVTLELPKPHARQDELINAFEYHKDKGVRFVAGACGTKFGKTFGCVIRLIKESWENKGSLNWWVAPSYNQSKMAYELVKQMLPLHTFDEYKADLRIVLLEPDGSTHSEIHFKSGDNPDTLRGFGVHFFIIDEAARIPEDSFVSVMTTVTQTGGHGIVISTPKGRGWFYDVYQRGEKFYDDGSPRFKPHIKNCKGISSPSCKCENIDPYPEWMAIRMPTWTNPYVPEESIVQAKNNLPEDVFRQEFAAQFLSDSAGVFRGIRNCEKGTIRQVPMEGSHYVVGVDLARINDYSVIIVMDRFTREVVYFDRFNQIAWEIQYGRIIDAAKHWNNAVVSIDWTGIGDPIVETLSAAGIPMNPYKIGGNIAKQQLIEKLRVNIEKGRISFPYIPQLRAELEAYEYNITESGVVRYSAPSNKHDDCVVALALANWVADEAPYVYRYYQKRGI